MAIERVHRMEAAKDSDGDTVAVSRVNIPQVATPTVLVAAVEVQVQAVMVQVETQAAAAAVAVDCWCWLLPWLQMER